MLRVPYCLCCNTKMLLWMAFLLLLTFRHSPGYLTKQRASVPEAFHSGLNVVLFLIHLPSFTNPTVFPLTLDFNGTWILNIPCKISNINVHIKCHVLAALLFHFHQFARFGSVLWDADDGHLWVLVGSDGTSSRREVPAWRNPSLGWACVYQCCVPLIVGGVCTDSWNTGNKFCQWKELVGLIRFSSWITAGVKRSKEWMNMFSY